MEKILVSDFDGTYYINDEDIRFNNLLVEKYKEKMIFIIATGRSYYDYRKKMEQYNIKSKYVILNHGATIIKDDKIIYNLIINNEVKNKLIKELDIKNAVNMFACSRKKSRISIFENNLTKIHIKYETIEKTLKIYKKLIINYSNYINCFLVSDKTAIEIVSNFANKKEAILKILNLEKKNIDNVFTVGDGDTDYEMLKYFNGYIMKKSSMRLKKLGLEEISSVSELILKINNKQ